MALAKASELREKIGGLADRITPLMERTEFHTALGEIWESVRATNNYLESTRPWTLNKEGKKEEVAGVLLRAAEAMRVLAILLHPFIPTASAGILEQIGCPDTPIRLEVAKTPDYIKMGTRIRKGEVLFQKVDAKKS